MAYLEIIEAIGKMQQDTLMIQLYMETKRYQRGIMRSRKLILKGEECSESEVL